MKPHGTYDRLTVQGGATNGNVVGTGRRQGPSSLSQLVGPVNNATGKLSMHAMTGGGRGVEHARMHQWQEILNPHKGSRIDSINLDGGGSTHMGIAWPGQGFEIISQGGSGNGPKRPIANAVISQPPAPLRNKLMHFAPTKRFWLGSFISYVLVTSKINSKLYIYPAFATNFLMVDNEN